MAELTQTKETDAIREAVRKRYAAAARAVAEAGQSSCCGAGASLTDEHGETVFGGTLYDEAEAAQAPQAAVAASLGCGVPTAVADLHEGETVLDLGSGAGADVLISARRVGPSGKAIGLDMTDEMLELARRNAAEAGADNVEFLKGHIEEIPLPEGAVDVVISNCVINLSGDKPRVIRETARVLKPGGRFAVSDVIADPDMDERTRADMAAYTGCIAGALTREQFTRALADAGLVDIEINETHRVHEKAGSAIIRARKPHGGAAATATSIVTTVTATAEAGTSCCDSRALSSCCEPSAKSECCGTATAATGAAPTTCGCGAGTSA
jgi:ubiquinone/menaquinone biosynthesis C-methylase UbiE